MAISKTTSTVERELQDMLKQGQVEAFLARVQALEAGKVQPVVHYKTVQHLLETGPDGQYQAGYERWKPLLDFERQRVNNHLDIASGNSVGLDWLQLCRDRDADPLFELYLQASGRNRETEILQLIYTPEGKHLAEFYLEDAGRYYIAGLVRFFLRMYNLPAAIELAWKARNRQTETAPVRSKNPTETGLNLLLLFFCLAFFAVVVAALQFPSPWQQVIRIAIIWPEFTIQNIRLLPTLLTILYIGSMILLILSLMHSKLLFRLLLPRMLSGILAGYMVIVFTKDFWMITAKMYSTANLFVVILITILISYTFLVNEVRRVIRHQSSVHLRSLTVLLLGLFEALAVGMILCDLMGETMGVAFNLQPYGIFGRVYPAYVVLTAPLALFIGIFVQLIWDEKPISEPF